MSAGRRRAGGFTYLLLLVVVAVSGAAAAAAGALWSHAAQREKEAELFFVGEQFRQAIALYYYRTPGGGHQYPATLQALLEDNRYPMTQRYLRKVWRDPITGSAEWGVVEAPGGGIMGVFSKSTAAPIKTGNFPMRWAAFDKAKAYEDWKFVFVPETPASSEGPGPMPKD